MSPDFENSRRTPFDLSGKVVVVVGGGQTPGPKIGNGRATAVVAARHGAQVVVADIDAAAAQQTVDLIAAEGGLAYPVTADVAKEQDCRAIFEVAVERSGRVDGIAIAPMMMYPIHPTLVWVVERASSSVAAMISIAVSFGRHGCTPIAQV